MNRLCSETKSWGASVERLRKQGSEVWVGMPPREGVITQREGWPQGRAVLGKPRGGAHS